MATRVLTERADNFQSFGRMTKSGNVLPFSPTELHHIYLKLDLESKYENAASAEDAKLFLRSVARAAMATADVAKHFGGELLEAQGSMIHACLPTGFSSSTSISEFASMLHAALTTTFRGRSRVQGWRMTIDTGNTLLVAGRGAHGDESWVSLGRAANRPAKHLYAQLQKPEDQRSLKRFHVGIFDHQTGRWGYQNLDVGSVRFSDFSFMENSLRTKEPTLHYPRAVQTRFGLVEKTALSVGSLGTGTSPTADKPQTYYGWVMRADLDGFTARVDQCFDNDDELQSLASDFYQIMNTATNFVGEHSETLAQLPWAGDNFSACAVFPSISEYEKALPKRLIDLSMDFEVEMNDLADQVGFGGWAHGIAGGSVHGNSNGNIFIAGIEVDERRYLVGAGEGVGRSIQAFSDINPEPEHYVVYQPDLENMDSEYKSKFRSATNTRNQQSSLFSISTTKDLLSARSYIDAKGAPVIVTSVGGYKEAIEPKHYYQ